MNEQLITEAMARADGYTTAKHNPRFPLIVVWRNPDGTRLGVGWDKLPDYLTDANQIDRMVRGLSYGQKGDYISHLLTITQGIHRSTELMICATTAQKVEAYLKAKGLWTKEME